MKKLTSISKPLVWLLAVGFLASCSEDEEVSQQGGAPVPPPAATFTVELPAIDLASENGRWQREEYSNAFHSVTSYSVWQSVLELHLAHPAITFAAAAQQEPQYLEEEDRWQWVLDTEFAGKNYQVDLYGRKAGSNSVWEMYVSQKGGIQNVLWLTGTHALDGTGGTWTFREEAESPRDVLQLEWKRSEGDIPYAKYTYLDSESQLYKDYIEYGSLANNDFNVFYNIYFHGEENLLKIEYNNETRIGRITDPDWFNDQAWHCWNSDYQNVSCQ